MQNIKVISVAQLIKRKCVGLTLLLLIHVLAINCFAFNQAASIKVIEKCNTYKHRCSYSGVKKAQQLAALLGQSLILYDVKKSKYLYGYWHLAIRPVDNTNSQPTIIATTNGLYLVPTMFNVVNQKQVFKGKTVKTSINLFYKEQYGMYIGKPDFKNLLLLLKAKKKTNNYIIIIDDLWNNYFYKMLMAIVKNKLDNYNIYLVPVFSLTSRTLMLGRHFYTLAKFDIPYYKIALFLSNLDYIWKYNDSRLTQACLDFLVKSLKLKDSDFGKIKAKYLKIYAQNTPVKIVEKTKKIIRAYKFDSFIGNQFVINGKWYINSTYIGKRDYIKNFLSLLKKNKKRGQK